jgi:hypothetical protein
MSRSLAAGALLAILAVGVVRADPLPRTELPIRAVTLSDGVRRYSVAIQVDGQMVEAGLDTGSTGLRLLPSALPPQARGEHGDEVRYHYGSGVEFRGSAIRAELVIGAVAGKARVDRIDHVGCTELQRECPAAKVDISAYRIEGDGLPGEGFEAILGIGLKPDPVPNPLMELGVRSWIVELPRPGDAGSGRLILNPDAQEIARYKMFKLMGDGNLVPGCILAETGKPRVCAPTLLDTGANGLRVQGGKPADILPQGTPAILAIGDRDSTAEMHVVIGRRDQASGMRLYPPSETGGLTLSLGIAPYFHWSVLYSAADHRLGVAER